MGIYTVSVSDVKAYMKCPYMYKTMEEYGITSKESDALQFGTFVHTAMEAKHRGLPAPSAEPLSPAMRKIWDRIAPYVEKFALPPEYKVIGVEVPLTWDDSIRYQGRLDGIVVYEDKLWSLQYKTYTRNLEALIEKVRIGMHESLYEELLRRTLKDSDGPQMVGGTILVAIKKMTASDVEDGLNPISVIPVLRGARERTARVLDIKKIARAMLNDSSPIRNTDACFGQYENSKCFLYDHCHLGMGINEIESIPRRARY